MSNGTPVFITANSTRTSLRVVGSDSLRATAAVALKHAHVVVAEQATRAVPAARQHQKLSAQHRPAGSLHSFIGEASNGVMQAGELEIGGLSLGISRSISATIGARWGRGQRWRRHLLRSQCGRQSLGQRSLQGGSKQDPTLHVNGGWAGSGMPLTEQRAVWNQR